MPSSARSDLDLAIRILERGADYSWYARVALVSRRKPYNDPRLSYLTIIPTLFAIQPYVRQMSQRMHNPTPPVELSNSPMPAVPSMTEEPGPIDGNKNKDDLYLFTRGQVFRKSTRRSAPRRPLSYPGPSAGILKHPAQPFTNYSDSGFDTPNLTMLSFPGQQDGFPSYSSHGSSHDYHSTTSTPGIPHPSVPPLDMFPFDSADRLPLFGSTTNVTTTVDGAGSAGSTSWLQQFGLQDDGPSMGFGRVAC